MKRLRFEILRLAVILGTLLSPLPSWSQDYSSRPLRFVLVLGPGSQADTTMRVISAKLTERLGWKSIIEHKPGGNFGVGIQAIKQSEPDGYTVLMGVGSFTVVAATNSNLPFDVIRDLAPVMKFAAAPLMLGMNVDVPAKSLAELIAYSKANPGKLSYGVTGLGGAGHLIGELLRHTTGLDMTTVPYKDGQAILVDLLAGRIQVGYGTVLDYSEYIKRGTVRGLVQLTPRRSDRSPDVPTGVEATGNSELDITSWYGFFMNARTSKPILDRLESELTATVRQPDVQDRLEKLALIPDIESSDQLRNRMETELRRWRGVVRRSNLKID